MNRYSLTLTALSLACTAQRPDQSDSVVPSLEAATAPCPVLAGTLQPSTTAAPDTATHSHTTASTPASSVVSLSAAWPNTHPGYRAASEYLHALLDCANGLDCDENSKRVLHRARTLVVDLPNGKDTSACRTIDGLLSSAWCNMLTESDVSDFRDAITGAVDCLDSLPGSRPTCIYRAALWFSLSNDGCSKTEPGRLTLGSYKSEFEPDQPWAVGLNPYGYAPWFLCLEGYGDKISWVGVRARHPENRTAP
jgi:hypothetical protein